MTYENENEVGEAISEKLNEGVIKREDLFITSKLWNTFHRPDLVEKAIKLSLKALKLDYVDLYLMHFPMAYKEGDDLRPKDENGKIIFSEIDYLDTWKAMEKLVDNGYAKNIGLSNFNSKQIQRILEKCRIKPVMNQIECHPYLNQINLSDFCSSNGIMVTAYSPLGSPKRPNQQENEPVLMEEPIILKIASQCAKSSAQILIRYQIQRGHCVIPKSSNKNRLAENFNVFDFELSSEQMTEIESVNRHLRLVPEMR